MFITVDPERDTIKKLKIFMENFDKSIIALTGTNQEIKNVLRKFKIYVKMNKNSPLMIFNRSQFTLFFFIDKNDRYINFRPNELKEDLSFN